MTPTTSNKGGFSTIIVPVNQLTRRNKAGTGVRVLFWLILAMTVGSRLFGLDHASYMIDEINIVREAVQVKSYSEIWTSELQRFTSYHRLPMLMMVLRASISACGEATKYFPSETSARLPVALFGVASILLLYLLGREVKDRRLGLWLMFLAAFNTFHVYYSREAYDYMMVIFFATGVLWMSVRLLRRWELDLSVDVCDAILYALFVAGLLQSHLAGLLFLAPWSALLFFNLVWDPKKRKNLQGKSLVLWMTALGVGFIPFLPFLVRVFGFKATESVTAKQISLAVFPEVFGHMGWGTAWWALLPFLACLVLGIVAAKRSPDRRLFVILGAGALGYFALQTFMLRVSRFEVRYYSALFPLVLLCAALGLDFLGQWISEKRKQITSPIPHLLLAVPLLAWMMPSLWMVVMIECRGQNYKAIARWVEENLPNNGIYSYWNGYEARGVPGVYQTPGRFVAYPTVWSSSEDYIRLHVKERLTSFFLRFPLACYVELAPDDVLVPSLAQNSPPPREKLFANRIWLTDPAYQWLVKWKTLPLGEAQWYTGLMDHIYVCYNKPSDLPKLTQQRGKLLYHYFGDEWSYGKDPQDNDWLITPNAGTFYIGNIAGRPLTATFKLSVMSPPSGCEISIYAPDGSKILERAPVGASFSEVTVSNVVLGAASTQFQLEVLPTPTSLNPQLLLYSLQVDEAK